MLTEDKAYLSAVRALVSFKVVDGNKRLLINSAKKEWLEKVRKIYMQRHPDKHYVIQDYAVRVLHKNMRGEVVKWGETKGFSLWEQK